MNITRLTNQYIREHPSVADCLALGLINYSALAREICESLKIPAFDAVLVACRRYRAKHADRSAHERRVMTLIKHAKVRVKNKIAVAIIDKVKVFEDTLSLQRHVRKDRGDFNLIEGEEVITVITNVDYLSDIHDTFGSKVKKVTKDLVQISMVFDPRLETTSGVVSHVYRLFAENSINIREEMSCWTDIIIVIDEKDIGRAMHVLSL